MIEKIRKIKGELEKAPRPVVIATKIGAPIILLLIALALLQFYPFEPYQADEYQLVPPIACPGDPIYVAITSGYRPGPYTLESGSADIYWFRYVKRDGERIKEKWGGQVIPTEPKVGPIVLHQSPALRTAPPIPDIWYPGAVNTTPGRMLGIVKVEQVVTVESHVGVEVKPPEECAGS